MIIRMSQPWRHPKTGVWYYRARVPADLVTKVVGTRMTFEYAGLVQTVTVGEMLKVRLATKSKAEAIPRHATVTAQVQARWEAHRQGELRLTKRQIVGLSGDWYRELLAIHEDDPGSPAQWEHFADQLIDGLTYLDPDSDGVETEPYDPKEAHRRLKRVFDVEAWLETRGLVVDAPSKVALEAAIAHALHKGTKTLHRRANGHDYGRDEFIESFGDPINTATLLSANATSPRIHAKADVSFATICDGWAIESKASINTQDQWRKIIDGLSKYLGHDDAAAVTKADAQKWKAHLLALKLSPATISKTYLAAAKAVFRWAYDNEHLSTYPFDGVKLARGQKAGDAMEGFTEVEARTIISAALQQTMSYRRWVPLLMAQSGARVAEIGQLRSQDVKCDDGIWYMSLRADAGSLKNQASVRNVPIHPKLIDLGFLEFAQGRTGPLFYDPARRNEASKRDPGKIVGKNLATWVHSLGLDVGLKARKAPNHAWRHRLETVCREQGVADRVIDALTGHKGSGVRYGTTTLSTLLRAVESVPLPGLEEANEKLPDTAGASDVPTS